MNRARLCLFCLYYVPIIRCLQRYTPLPKTCSQSLYPLVRSHVGAYTPVPWGGLSSVRVLCPRSVAQDARLGICRSFSIRLRNRITRSLWQSYRHNKTGTTVPAFPLHRSHLITALITPDQHGSEPCSSYCLP